MLHLLMTKHSNDYHRHIPKYYCIHHPHPLSCLYLLTLPSAASVNAGGKINLNVTTTIILTIILLLAVHKSV
jgi:hypothetical protein